MGQIAERDLLAGLDRIVNEFNLIVDAKISLTPRMVREIRDHLTIVRDCYRNLSELEGAVPSLRLVEFPGCPHGSTPKLCLQCARAQVVH